MNCLVVGCGGGGGCTPYNCIPTLFNTTCRITNLLQSQRTSAVVILLVTICFPILFLMDPIVVDWRTNLNQDFFLINSSRQFSWSPNLLRSLNAVADWAGRQHLTRNTCPVIIQKLHQKKMNGKDIKANQLRSVRRLVQVRWGWGIVYTYLIGGATTKWWLEVRQRYSHSYEST